MSPAASFKVERFAKWLTEMIGLDPASLGSNAIEHAVRSCADGQTPDEYWRRLSADPHEQQRLIDTVIVPETWFFRDAEAFAALTRTAVAKLAAAPTRRLRVLSLPCSTGEEPYSAAIALLDAGVDPRRFTIDAADISVTSIAAARRAVYGRNAFRRSNTAQQALQQRYFEEVPGGLRPVDLVRDTVRLRQANLFDPASLPPGGYDFVFCRNVLIYFDRARQALALETLSGLLADDALLFVGPAESGMMLRAGFAPEKIPRAFAFRRHAAGTVAAGVPPASRRVSAPKPAATAMQNAVRRNAQTVMRNVGAKPPTQPTQPIAGRLHVVRRPATTTSARLVNPGAASATAAHTAAPAAATAATAARATAATAPISQSPSLSEVARLADAGKLGDAQRLLDNYLSTQAPSAEAYYLSGLIADAADAGAAAREAYKKAVYLEPEHTGALAHLAARLELEGDREGAQRLMRRVARLAGKSVAASKGNSGAKR
ncbi:MAG: CheR family methyltransferase [Janthinobacterium lividum]